jgi:hypothetical protein
MCLLSGRMRGSLLRMQSCIIMLRSINADL